MYLGTVIQDIFAAVERAGQTKHLQTTSGKTELSVAWLLSPTENQQSNGPTVEVRSDGSQSPVLDRAAGTIEWPFRGG